MADRHDTALFWHPSPWISIHVVRNSLIMRSTRLIQQLSMLFCLILASNSFADHSSISREQKIKAAYLYHLTKFIDWPSEHPNKQSQAITICIAGNTTFTHFMLQLEARKAKGRPIHIEPLATPGDTSQCQLIFFQEGHQMEKGKSQQFSQQGTLSISENSNFIKNGGMVGMVIIDNHVRLHINPATIKQAGIMVSANLLEVATIVSRQGADLEI